MATPAGNLSPDGYLPSRARIRYESIGDSPSEPLFCGELEWHKTSGGLFIGEDDGTCTQINAQPSVGVNNTVSPVKLWFLTAR